MRPRWAGGAGIRTRADYPLSIPQGRPPIPRTSNFRFFYIQKCPLKPLEPICVLDLLSKTSSQTGQEYIISVRGLSRNCTRYNPPITPSLLPAYSGRAQWVKHKHAPSALKLLTPGGRVKASSPEVIGGRVFYSTALPRLTAGGAA